MSSQADSWEATWCGQEDTEGPGQYKHWARLWSLGLLVHGSGSWGLQGGWWQISIPSKYNQKCWKQLTPQRHSHHSHAASPIRSLRCPCPSESSRVVFLLHVHLPWAQMSLFTCQGARGFCVHSTRKGGTAGHGAERLPPQETNGGWRSGEPRECSQKGSLTLSCHLSHLSKRKLFTGHLLHSACLDRTTENML